MRESIFERYGGFATVRKDVYQLLQEAMNDHGMAPPDVDARVKESTAREHLVATR